MVRNRVTRHDELEAGAIHEWLAGHAEWVDQLHPGGLPLADLADLAREDLPGLGLLAMHRQLHASDHWHCPERDPGGVVLWTITDILPDPVPEDDDTERIQRENDGRAEWDLQGA